MVIAKLGVGARVLAIGCMIAALAGCESTLVTKKIDYKSTTTAPALELPPDLTTPQYDDRYSVTTASGLAAAQGSRARGTEVIAPNANAEARIVRGGTERWLVVKTSPEIAWNTTKQFWQETGFVLAVDQPTVGVMETDWAENRANMPKDFLQNTIGKVLDVFGNTYKRDKFRTRVERGAEPGTMEIYVSHRGAEQVPTTYIDSKPSSPAAFVWAPSPPDPGLEAEMLTRLLVKFGAPSQQASAAVDSAMKPEPANLQRARLQKSADGVSTLLVDDGFDRAWRRVGLALDRVGFTVVDRDRSNGTYFVRYANPETDTKKDEGWLAKLMFWKDTSEKPEQYRITVAQADPCVVSVQDTNGKPDKSPNGEKILALLQDQLK